MDNSCSYSPDIATKPYLLIPFRSFFRGPDEQYDFKEVSVSHVFLLWNLDQYSFSNFVREISIRIPFTFIYSHTSNRKLDTCILDLRLRHFSSSQPTCFQQLLFCP